MIRLRFAALATIALSFLAAAPAHAYYDDVHYVVTYYVARQAGYTPEQAFRIASACVSVDYDPDTEPVQGPSQLALATTPFTGPAADPRWKFHAMRDEDALHAMGIEDVFRDCIGDNGKSAQRAEDMVKAQEAKLWDSAQQIGNPGVFLHFFQDEVPHHGYGTWWGHWPMLPGSVQAYHDKGLPIGGVTDWIAYRSSDVTAVCQTTHAWLAQFMDRNSPHQAGQPFNAGACAQLVGNLAKANPAPTDIDSEAKRSSYIDFFAQSKVVSEEAAKPNDPFGLVGIAAGQGVMISDIDFSKLKNGPDLVGACDVVDAALKAAGMGDKIPRQHFLYSLDANGKLEDQSMADKFTLVGTLETSTKGSESVVARVLLEKRDAAGQTTEVPLRNVPDVTMNPGTQYKWEQLPIGNVVLELTHLDGKKSKHSFTLDKRVNTFPPITVDDGLGIGGHWLWKNEVTDEKGKKQVVLVPCYLTPQDDGTFKGVYFPWMSIDTLSQDSTRMPTRISYTPTSANTFAIEWEYPDGPRGTGTMTLSGDTLSGPWVEDGSGNSGNWTWIRPDPQQKKKLESHFGR